MTCGRFAGKISVNFYDRPIEQLAEPRNHESMRLVQPKVYIPSNLISLSFSGILYCSGFL